ncbi:citrate lyase subunit beta/citryl-CoA lyase [Pseudomonas lini]|jgi:citrate lyase subunit beta/citryl-CoA lyase|uniref:HpcH/HpaI aldolase/citrate lyase family protein n=1 Tax=Pseudomonas lini TaxID=163011 RepID=UPI002786D84A|nr:CoA ester lyase [Pseudomonas lini]MDQ0124904.1 citrate lyase subunit beta/citryl-CoA lyase [Pseudomonas lini]
MRSYLFVPGDRPERFAKALAAGADRVILDLEDAVSPANKPIAREHIARAIEEGAEVMIRINSEGSDAFADDLDLLRRLRVKAVMLPKAESAESIRALADATDAAIVPLIESALGVWRVLDVAGGMNVERLAFGSIDFQVDVGCAHTDEALLYARSKIVLASRVAGLQAPIDGVSVILDDGEVITAEATRSRELGFAGKLCIHPRQVQFVNRAFSPSPQELAWAQRVVEASRRAGGAAVSVDGAMVDLPVLIRAQNLLALAGSVS